MLKEYLNKIMKSNTGKSKKKKKKSVLQIRTFTPTVLKKFFTLPQFTRTWGNVMIFPSIVYVCQMICCGITLLLRELSRVAHRLKTVTDWTYIHQVVPLCRAFSGKGKSHLVQVQTAFCLGGPNHFPALVNT